MLIVNVFSYADVVLNGNGTRTFSYVITAEEWKALAYLLKDPEAWLNHMVTYKISRAERTAIKFEDLSDKIFEKLTKQEITTLITNATLKTRIERDAEALEALNDK